MVTASHLSQELAVRPGIGPGTVDARKIPDADLDVACLGPESADTFAIYLHGMDTVDPSQQELENRRVLNEIAKLRNIRFALPSSQVSCPMHSASICWGWKFDEPELNEILHRFIEKS